MIFLKIFFKSIGNSIKDFYENKKSFFMLALFLIIFFIFILLYTFFFIFHYLIAYIPGGYSFSPKILGIIILSIFVFTIILTFIASISTFFKSEELKLIIPFPVKDKDFFIYGLGKLIYFSSYASVFILTPVFIAYGLALNLNITYYILALLIAGLITFLATLFGIIIFWIFVFSLMNLKKIYRKIIFIVFSLFLAFLIFKKYKEFNQIKNNNLSFIENAIFNFDYNNLFLPYNWFIKSIYNFQLGNYILSLLYLIFIISFTYLVYKLIIFIGGKTYIKAYEIFNKDDENLKKKISFKSIFTKNKFINLIIKDFIVNFKDPSQWTQIIVFVFLMILYILLLKGKTSSLLENPTIVSLISLGGVGISAFFISAISLRFIYPNISLEGKSFWILKTIPISSKIVIILKFIFFSIILLLINLILLYYYIKSFGIFNNIGKYLIILSIFSTLFIGALYLSLGAIFPNFKENNPSKIATSYGGMLSIFASNLAILLILFINFFPLKSYYNNLYHCNNLGLDNFIEKIFISSGILIILTIILLVISILKFKKLEN